MAVDAFLKLDGVTGESPDKKKPGEIEVLAWSWGMSNGGTTHMGTGGGSGKANVGDLSITKYLDKSSPTLMLFCCNGKHIQTGMLTLRKSSGDGKAPLEYIKMKLTEIIVTAVSEAGGSGSERLTETISLNFAQVDFSYFPQKPDGTADTAATLTWDIAGNQNA